MFRTLIANIYTILKNKKINHLKRWFIFLIVFVLKYARCAGGRLLSDLLSLNVVIID